MNSRTKMAHEIANDQFISRLGSLPVVSSAWTHACDMYQKTKESNCLFRATCNLAESGIQTVVLTTKPLVDKCQPQIEKVNVYACEKLAILEEQYPVITKPTDEILRQSKETCTAVLKPVTDRVIGVKESCYEQIEATKHKVESVKDFGVMTVNKTLDTPLGRYALEKVNDALTISEEYIEKYLPPMEDELLENEHVPVELDEVNTLTRVTSISTKLRQRMFRRAMRDIKELKMRSQEKLESLAFTVDLIQFAKSGAIEVKDMLEEKLDVAHSKVVYMWEQINDESNRDLDTETLEGKTIAVGRQLTKQLKHGMDTVTGYIPAQLQPSLVRSQIEQALKYTEELYESFMDAKRFDEVPSWILIQAQEKMSYIQDTISFLANSLVTGSINWLDIRVSIDGILLEEPQDMVNLNGHLTAGARTYA